MAVSHTPILLSPITGGRLPSDRRQPSAMSCEFRHASKSILMQIGSGIFAASWFQDRYGYRRTIQLSLILMACFVFIVFL